MKNMRSSRIAALPRLILAGFLFVLAACSTPPPDPTRPTTIDTDPAYPMWETATPDSGVYPPPLPQIQPTLDPYPGPGSGEPVVWERANLAEIGLSLEIPSTWQPVPEEEFVWEPEPGSNNRLGVRYAPIGPGQMIEAVLLPANSVVQDMTTVQLPFGPAQLFTVQVLDAAVGQGAPVAIEQHLLFTAAGGRGYAVYISAPGSGQLSRMQAYFDHIQASIQVSD